MEKEKKRQKSVYLRTSRRLGINNFYVKEENATSRIIHQIGTLTHSFHLIVNAFLFMINCEECTESVVVIAALKIVFI